MSKGECIVNKALNIYGKMGRSLVFGFGLSNIDKLSTFELHKGLVN